MVGHCAAAAALTDKPDTHTYILYGLIPTCQAEIMINNCFVEEAHGLEVESRRLLMIVTVLGITSYLIIETTNINIVLLKINTSTLSGTF